MLLAELNISRWKIDPGSDVARGFTDNVARVNALAERSDGFVWRLLDEQRDDKGGNAVCPDDNTLMTLSVWKTVTDLEQFVWNTVHKQIYNRKDNWFGVMESHHFVMWWIEDDHRPTIEEAARKLQHLDKFGDTDEAFGWSHLPHVKLWQQQRCG